MNIICCEFLGVFSAVCWTDFVQGLLMLAALLAAPIVALFAINSADFVSKAPVLGENYYNLLSGGTFNKKSVVDILSGLGW